METINPMPQHLYRLVFFTLSSLLLNGCVTPPKPSNLYVPIEYSEKEFQQKSDETGLIYVSIFTHELAPITVSINNLPFSTHYEGYMRLPLYPGDYVLKTQAHNSSPNEIPFSIAKGETRYFMLDGIFASSPYKEYPEEEFNWGKHLKMNQQSFRRNKQVSSTTPRHNLLPDTLKNKVDNCLSTNSFEACSIVYNEIPLELIDPQPRQEIIRLVENIQTTRNELAMDEALRSTLSKSALRDHYMVGLSSALSNREFNKAIPFFEKLIKLDMPLDPDFDYFYAEALYETGEEVKAIKAITRYIRNNGSSAQFYQEALDLLNKIQLSS